VAAAAAARASLETEWAREGAAGRRAAATPDALATDDTGAPAPETTPARVLLVLTLEGTDESVLGAALGLSAFEASQRLRRGGPDLHRILPAREAASEAQRLRGQGLEVLEIAEDEVRRAQPVYATRGAAASEALALGVDDGPLRLTEADLILVVRGAIARDHLRAPGPLRRLSVASLEPGYRIHLHRRKDLRPVELDPAAFDFSPGGADGGAQRQLTAWIDRLFPGTPRDDSFRFAMPAFGPATPSAGGSAAAVEALVRATPGARPVLDNVAQFRFHSAWRAAVQRRRPR